jgi:hypothetical protein
MFNKINEEPQQFVGVSKEANSLRLVGSFDLNTVIEKLKRNIDALSSHSGKSMFGDAWVETILVILQNSERENNLLLEKGAGNLEGMFVSYRLEKIAAAAPKLAKQIFEDNMLKSKLLFDNKFNSNTLEKIAKSHRDSATYIFQDSSLRRILLAGRNVTLDEFLERGSIEPKEIHCCIP